MQLGCFNYGRAGRDSAGSSSPSGTNRNACTSTGAHVGLQGREGSTVLKPTHRWESACHSGLLQPHRHVTAWLHKSVTATHRRIHAVALARWPWPICNQDGQSGVW